MLWTPSRGHVGKVVTVISGVAPKNTLYISLHKASIGRFRYTSPAINDENIRKVHCKWRHLPVRVAV